MLRFVALAFAAGLMAAPSFAADVAKPAPVAKPIPVVVARTNALDGFYVGGNAGYGWGTRKGEFDDEFPADGDGIKFNYKQQGWILGGQVGVNHFFGPSLFVGAEVNADLAAISGNLDHIGVGTYSAVGSAMAKVGFGWGNAAIYAEGGIGIESFSFNGTFCQFNSQNSGFGWGVGAEAAISSHNSLFAKWDRFNIDAKDANCNALFTTIGVKTSGTLDLFRVGFNHYFN